jgi:hypothetical protein
VSSVNDATIVCRAVFDVLGDDVDTVGIDAYSDYAGQMPADIQRAEAWLRERGLLADRRDPGEAIRIRRSDDIGWEIARAYTLWSTHVRLRDGAGTTLALLDDGAHAVTVDLTPKQIAQLTESIGSAATITEMAS